jgi:hypothetical protein
MAMAFAGCRKYLDVNENPNVPTDVTESLLLAPLETAVSHYITAGYAASLVNQWMQNMVPNQPMPNTASYLVTSVTFDDFWNSHYVVVLNNLYLLNRQANVNGNSSYAGIAKVLTAYTLGSATDMWGDIPYTEAFNGMGNTKPGYDPQENVYNTIQTLLDSAVVQLTAATGKEVGSDDYYFQGDMSKWIKMAYTLKARYYMHLTKAPGHTAAQQAMLALAALENGMSSNADDCMYAYAGASNSANPWSQHFYNTTTLILSSRYVDSLKTRNDPRLPYLVSKAKNTGLYTGNEIGTGLGVLENFSVGGSFYASLSSNVYVLTASEALLLKAEATLLTAGFAAAQPIFRKAVAENMVKVGVDTNTTIAQTYLAKYSVLTADHALQQIIEEKNTSNFLSTECWVDWRRTGFPKLNMIQNNTVTEIPRRFLYPLNEATANPQPVQSAKLSDRVWWDS